MNRRIYIDACIAIYLIEKHPAFEAKILKTLAEAKGSHLAVSPLLRLEVLAKPLRDGDTNLIQEYETFIASQIMLSIPECIYDYALQLRAKFRLKTPDALHLATAQYHGCTDFWTNDTRLNEASGNSLSVINLA